MKKFLFTNIVFLCLFSNSAFAQFNKEDFEKYVDKFGQKIIKISASKISDKQRVEKLVKLIDESVDIKWISRFVLGKHYRSFSTAEFQRFLTLYKKYMINSYGSKFATYKGSKFVVNDIKFQKIFYLAETEFYSVDKTVPISVGFRMKKRGDEIYIIDFIAEGVSLLESQRSELDSAISSMGVIGFLDDLDKKVKEQAKDKKSGSKPKK